MPAATPETEPNLEFLFLEPGLLEPARWKALAELQVGLTAEEISVTGPVDLYAIGQVITDPEYSQLLEQSPPDPDLMMLSYIYHLVEPGHRLDLMLNSSFGLRVFGAKLGQDIRDNTDGKMVISLTLPNPVTAQERIQDRLKTDSLPSGVQFVAVDKPHITDPQTTDLVMARQHGFALGGWQAIHDALDHALGAAALDPNFHVNRAIPFAETAIKLRKSDPETSSKMEKLLTLFIDYITTKITSAAIVGSRKPDLDDFYKNLVNKYGSDMVDSLTGELDSLHRTVDVSWNNARDIASAGGRRPRLLRRL